MIPALRQQILERMKAKNLSIAALERKANLSIHSARNFLKGKVKSPKIDSLQAIAEALDCSLLDLMELDLELISEQGRTPPAKIKGFFLLEDISLVKSCCAITINLIKEKELILSLENYLNIIKMSYLYSLRAEPRKVDTKFISWLIDEKVQ